MASESSFDIVSKMDMQELNNAMQQATREIETRFDFKGSKSSITLEKEEIVIVSDDDFKLGNVLDILHAKMAKRSISLKGLNYGKVEPASSGTVRQRLSIKQGLDQDNCKTIHQLLKDSKLKIKSQTQGDQIRVTGKSKDDLQQAMQLLRQADLPVELQFTNYR